MLRYVRFGAAMLALILGAGCSSGGAVDQENVCEVGDWRGEAVAKACKRGQKVVFLPDSFGDKQLPILFTAFNCDHRYSIALTEGGVSCIYNPITRRSSE
ncbi:MAG: hypothetical protein LBN32_00300 [Helicobacteraceae bacterium]|nr:hypothetical protein [Helicobacteraceae bacterium]